MTTANNPEPRELPPEEILRHLPASRHWSEEEVMAEGYDGEHLPSAGVFDYWEGKLSRAGQIDFEILQQDLERRLWLAENTRPFESDPRIYSSYINDSTYLILTQSTQPLETNVASSSLGANST